MSIINDTAEEILRLLKENGGTISGAELRTHLADVSPANRLKAITNLRNEGRLRSTGATTLVVYHLPEVRHGASKSVAKAASDDQFDRAERMANARLAGHPDATPAGSDAESSLTPAAHATCLKVPLIGEASEEVQFMAALEFISRHFSDRLDIGALNRGAIWLASKHRIAA